jgi:hypothetical protein
MKRPFPGLRGRAFPRQSLRLRTQYLHVRHISAQMPMRAIAMGNRIRTAAGTLPEDVLDNSVAIQIEALAATKGRR